MKYLKITLVVLWKVWFYVWVAIITFVISPALLILTSHQRWYSKFYWIAKYLWAYPILYGIGVIPKITHQQKQIKGKSYMYVANHTSMIDIMLMLIATKNPFVFVGKKELSKLPLFGFFYKRVAILVDRSDARSRHAVYDSARERLDQGLSVCIFPEGKVPEEHILLDDFKDGAFRLALQYQIPIVPMSFPDNKKRFPYSANGSLGVARAIIHPFIKTEGVLNEKLQIRKLKEQTRELILSELYY